MTTGGKRNKLQVLCTGSEDDLRMVLVPAPTCSPSISGIHLAGVQRRALAWGPHDSVPSFSRPDWHLSRTLQVFIS